MQLEQYYWYTIDGQKLRMIDMEEKHLINAFNHTCEKEFEYFTRQNIFNSLREKIEEIAKFRNIKLKYPDERFPADRRYSKYFSSMRQVKAMCTENQKPEEIILASNSRTDISPLNVGK